VNGPTRQPQSGSRVPRPQTDDELANIRKLTADPHQVAQLQRLVGNQATQEIIDQGRGSASPENGLRGLPPLRGVRQAGAKEDAAEAQEMDGDQFGSELQAAGALTPMGASHDAPIQTKPNDIQRDDPPAAAAATTQRYNPPSSISAGVMPRQYDVDFINTRGLHDAIRNASWSNGTRRDRTWEGWTRISQITSPDFVSANLPTMLGNGFSENLPVQTNPLVDLYYRIEIRGTINPSSFNFLSAEGTGISTSTSGGASTTSSGSATSETSMGANAGVEVGPENRRGTAGVEASSTSSTTREAGGGWSGTASRGSSFASSVRFGFSIDWEVNIEQEADVSTFGTIATLGLGNLAAWILEGPVTTRASSAGEIRFPGTLCTPAP
jgi:hypothetical protein